MNEKKGGVKWLNKLKNIKHIEIYVIIIFIAILGLIYMSSFSKPKQKTTETMNGELSVSQYVTNLENNLSSILSSIDGVDNVRVMITLDMSKAGVNNSNITLDEFPDIKGVLITASGLNDVKTKMKVLHAVEAVIEVTNGKIEILSSK